ncbi:excisionase family DNA-binding protein [Segatella bryantii]|uniref:excisionase family DNA-binding protein n=1 Tax=Segatella bryantii TaxID=77095 RepID=UPI001EDBF10F|nr:excisionase family DNA-binding protein [Segatella bryantii]UKK71998.1 excisionase family DNA-binding protein [Segatella bryantii]
MQNENLTFNDLPQVVAQFRDEVMGMRAMLSRQQAESCKLVKENRHKPMTVDEAIEYTHIPRGTMYMKLEDGTILATKPGRRWILYQDELDKWLGTKRRNTVPMTADEENDTILASHKRKPDKHDWQNEADTSAT